MTYHVKVDLGYIHYNFERCNAWGKSTEFEELIYFSIISDDGLCKTYYFPRKDIVSLIIY